MHREEPPAGSDERLEARIVAWVLGEASAFEAEELARLCAERPDLEAFRRRTEKLHGLLQENAAPADDAAWKLPAEKRATVTRLFAEPAKPASRRGRHAALAIAACVAGVLAVRQFMVTPDGGDSGRTPEIAASSARAAAEPIPLDELRAQVRQQEEIVEERRNVAEGMGRMNEASAIQSPQELARMESVDRATEPEDFAVASENLEADQAKLQALREELSHRESGGSADQMPALAAATPAALPADEPGLITRARGMRTSEAGSSTDGFAEQEGSITDMAFAGRDLQRAGNPLLADLGDVPAQAHAGENLIVTGGPRSGNLSTDTAATDALLEDPGSPPAVTAAPTDELRRNLYLAEAHLQLGKLDEAKQSYEEALGIDPSNSAARRGMERIAAMKSDWYRAAHDHARAELLMQVDEAWELSIPAAPAEQPPVDEPETNPAEEPYSTFSLNVSDVSFRLAHTALLRGERPEPGQVKVEQFYNAVDFGDPAPVGEERIAGVVEQSAHPVIPGRNLVRIGLKTAAAGRGADQPLRLTLLVDQSGSMARDDRREALRGAMRQLAGLLGENDRISVIGFSRTPRLLHEALPGDQAAKLPEIVGQAPDEGGTNLEEALELAAQIAARHREASAQNRIVLLTDGAANLGDADPGRLAERVTKLRRNGIALDVAGVGTGKLNDELLAELARTGDGRYYVVDGGDESFADQLAGAFRPAAEDVKVQVSFNPERVAGYRLIGFENDRLRPEDFRNDAVDAAELAADEGAVALYQVQPLPEGRGEIGEVTVRFRDTTSGTVQERSWTIPYDPAAPAFDRASPTMQLAGLALLAAEELRGGPLAAGIELREFTTTKAAVREHFRGDPKVARLIQMVEALE